MLIRIVDFCIAGLLVAVATAQNNYNLCWIAVLFCIAAVVKKGPLAVASWMLMIIIGAFAIGIIYLVAQTLFFS